MTSNNQQISDMDTDLLITADGGPNAPVLVAALAPISAIKREFAKHEPTTEHNQSNGVASISIANIPATQENVL